MSIASPSSLVPTNVKLFSLRSKTINYRTIEYSIAGKLESGSESTRPHPILYFYPAGGNRRMTWLFSDLAEGNNIMIICLNRPGKNGTSGSETKTFEPDTKSSKLHVDTSLSDIIEVLDHLKTGRVSLFAHCAGMPFLLAFANRYRERTTGRIMAVAAWIQPLDITNNDNIDNDSQNFNSAAELSSEDAGSSGSGNTKTKLLYRFAGKLPGWLIKNVTGTAFSSLSSSIHLLPTSLVVNQIKQELSKNEHEEFENRNVNPNRKLHNINISQDFLNSDWARTESGGEGSDIEVLVSCAYKKDLDIDLEFIAGNYDIRMYHGTNDNVVPYESILWFVNKMRKFNKELSLITLEKGSHSGPIFMLHEKLRAGLIELVN